MIRRETSGSYVDLRSIDWATVVFRNYHPCPECDRLVSVDGADVVIGRQDAYPGWPVVSRLYTATVYLLYSCCVDWASMLTEEV
jgi:hypothetical protein